MNVHVPLWIVVLVAVGIAGLAWTKRMSDNDGNWGMGGPFAFLLTVIAVLVVLLVHAWGWL